MGFILDTNLYIAADRDSARAEALDAFYDRYLPQIHLHAIVAQELLSGAIAPSRARDTYQTLIDPFERRRRVLVPDFQTWKRTGEIMRRLALRRLITPGRFSRSFVNDVMLAASCRQFGHVLVTANERDFTRIREVEQFEFVPPYPN
ncbi:MAG: type II toxin-antitoxin system VapC family toxin [Gemmatimonadetes bacterium]|nr:type II toxin-antitoxin system VapC family toxin [Gemmatimonadota bacterium]